MSLPSVTLKLATSMDGRIALSNGVSQWITGPDSRARVHRMRAEHDAVMVGVGTVLADDPLLTARTIPLPLTQPARIILDSRLRTPRESRLVNSVGLGPVILAWGGDEPGTSGGHLGDEIVTWRVGDRDGRVSPRRLLERCAVEGYHKIFLEGGGKVAASFIQAGLVDTIAWFRAPILIGGDGLPAIAALGLSDMPAAPRWRTTHTERIGEDVLEVYQRG